MKRIYLIFTLFVSFYTYTQAQSNVWSTLAMVKFINGDDPMYADSGAGFAKMIEDLNGEEIEVKGYIVPLEGQIAQSHFMYSAYPYNMCFFCGKAGPESVMEVFMEEGDKVKFTEKAIRLKGIFRWQPNVLNDIMFTLEHATLVK